MFNQQVFIVFILRITTNTRIRYSRNRDSKKQKFMSYIICFTIIVYIHILLSKMMSRKYNEGKKLRNTE